LRIWTLGLIAALGVSCAALVPPKPPAADDRARALADTYLNGWLDRNPDEATIYAIAGRHHDRLPDNSLEAQKTWEAKEGVWLADARGIDPDAIQDLSLRATYAIVREALEGSIGARVCRSELWRVSQTQGWHVGLGFLITIQPVGTPEAEREALARWSALPGYIDTEIVNLREGRRQKYLAPKNIVRIVIGQIGILIAATGPDQPFLSPAVRDKSPEFARAYEKLFKEQMLPAFIRFRDFLEREYLPAARDEIGVSANPNGAECYAASVREYSTLTIDAKAVHALGLAQMDLITNEMKAIGERSFQTSDVAALLSAVRTDPKYLFKSREELIAYSQAALARAKAAAPSWFGIIPRADVTIEPYPKFREQNGPGEYNAPAEDGSRPGLFYISAYQAEKKSRSTVEATAFHETIPGHHLQVTIAVERKTIHPLGRYLFNSGYSEGWGLYSERLADEMKLYSSDVDRLGMLGAQAMRAARLVVDSGLHTMNWTREQAIDYMLSHTTEDRDSVVSEIDRYIIWPGQATSYMLGMLEIRKARDEAQAHLGSRFDIKAFHDRVLEDGSVPLSYLSAKIRAWSSP
jgi:uncharacterized protein (DUF885 family)